MLNKALESCKRDICIDDINKIHLKQQEIKELYW